MSSTTTTSSSLNSQRKSRDEYKKEKELEEARKAGNAPAELDEDGNEINPHIPQYMRQAPWYVDTNKPSLKHQRAFNKKEEVGKGWYQRGAAAQGFTATKYRKGACTNCGSMTHVAKDCCERPRKVGAKFTNDDIKPDEIIQKLEFDYDSKRDPYNGYDPSSYKEIMELYEKADRERKKKKMEEIIKSHKGEENINAEDLTKELEKQEQEQDVYDAENVAPIQKLDPKSRTTIRNLRIREDTAKYLYNLDLDSAFYEPKSRSMRENPLPNTNPNDTRFAGDNFTRTSGDTNKFRDMQLFAWEAQDKGQNVDISSAPSQAGLLHLEFLKKKEQLKEQSKKLLLSKYGGEEHLLNGSNDGSNNNNDISIPQTENYQEYSASGKLIKGEEIVVKSKYEEDVYLNNHKSVWGSYWENGSWGFQCCKQTIKLSYCTGEQGRKLKDNLIIQNLLKNNHNDNNSSSNSDNNEEKEEEPKSLLEQHLEKSNKSTAKEKEEKKKEKKEKKEKEKRLEKALKEQDEINSKSIEKDERKLKYNSLKNDNYQITDEDMEAYNLKRKRSDDPMANFKDSIDE
ncbi:hypothetical protein CYY_003709 [Polysphondylium violaceum]|uniref:Pre-mRNA-splicing factor SLU7 n=1 Tax=Polysphondylium violaceum TaxID=133409 RepID=A0A8J4V005_9MYCE|nr:hypothetical protein CYY_003709 [Polysphondylium violaceum]